jgi:hypothetical protein
MAGMTLALCALSTLIVHLIKPVSFYSNQRVAPLRQPIQTRLAEFRDGETVMQSRFNPKAAALMAVAVLLHVACGSSGADGGGGGAGSGAGVGGVAAGGEGGPSGGQLGSGAGVGSAAGAAAGSGGIAGGSGQSGSASAGRGGGADTGGAPPSTGGAGGVGPLGAGGCDEAQGFHLSPDGETCTNAPRALCIFDYDLVLSSHSCAQTASSSTEYLCRTNDCTTYAWHDQCLATAAHTAIAECIRHGAYIGIASHSQFDACWNDKVIETLTPAKFPELFSSIHYDKPGTDFAYPAIDDRANWNCDTCAYHFDGMIKGSKAALIRKVMAHYGLSPKSEADQSRVVYWEDDPAFLDDVRTNLPKARAIAVASTNPASNGAGCGIQPADVTAGWAALAANAR